MRISDMILLSFQNVARLKTKSLLTVFSVAIGVTAVYMILSLCSIGEMVVQEEIDRLGIDGLSLYTEINGASGSKIEPKYADIVKNQFLFVEDAMPLVTVYGTFSLNHNAADAVYMGVNEDVSNVLGVKIKYGRTFYRNEIKTGKKVALIDSDLARTAYQRENIIGKTIFVTIGGKRSQFEIIGIFEPQTTMLDGISGGKIPDFIYIPYTTANQLNNTSDADQIAIRCSAEIDTTQAVEQIVNELNQGRKTMTFAVENINGYISRLKRLIGMVSMLLTTIGSISLIVAGFGVMNRMLSSVTERKKEIGIWIAVGAKKKDIFTVFLCEAIFLCLFGSTIGAIFGFTLTAGLIYALGTTMVCNFKLLLIPLFATFVIGILFGVMPSNAAAKMHPAELLRDI